MLDSLVGPLDLRMGLLAREARRFQGSRQPLMVQYYAQAWWRTLNEVDVLIRIEQHAPLFGNRRSRTCASPADDAPFRSMVDHRPCVLRWVPGSEICPPPPSDAPALLYADRNSGQRPAEPEYRACRASRIGADARRAGVESDNWLSGLGGAEHAVQSARAKERRTCLQGSGALA